MSERYNFRWFHKDDLDFYIEGLNESLYDRYDKERYRWKFESNPYRLEFIPIVIAVEKESGKPIGFNSFLPLMIQSRDSSILAVQGCDGYVHKDHRRRGVFSETIKFMETHVSGCEPEFLMGFNFAGAAAAAMKAGSNSVCNINSWEFEPANLTAKISPSKEKIALEKSCIEKAHKFYEMWNKSTDLLHVKRSLEYMRWRFIESPLKDYSFHIVRKGIDNLGYIVTSITEDEEGSTVMGIDDYLLNISIPRSVLNLLSELISHREDAERVELLTRKGDYLDASLISIGVVPEPRYTLIIKDLSGHSFSGGILYQRGLEMTRSESWHITTSDIY